MPLLASNFTTNLLYGTTIVEGGWANVNLKVDAFAFEGDKTFTVKLRKDSTNGQIVSQSSPITIKDYTTLVGLAANISTVNEGNLVQFTLTTTNVVNYTNVAYSVFPVTANLTSADFVANTGYVTIVNNVGVFALQANADLSLVDEAGEVFRAQIRDKNNTNVFISSNITIGDVSRGFNVLSFTESAITTAEGETITLSFTATNANNVIIYYSTDGNATTSTFTGGNTGSFILNGISNTFTLLPTGVPYGTTQNFRVVLRSDTPTGTVVATSNNLIVSDSSIAYMSATGGTITDSGGYRIHAFTTSGNLTISALGAGAAQNFVDYLVVAGGGGGGAGGSNFGNPYQYSGGGGGGAGGLLTSNVVITTTGNTVVLVGAGGQGKGIGQGGGFVPGINGSNTSVAFAAGPSLIAFGGGGGSGGDFNLPVGSTNGTGRPGGSGGGTTAFNNYSPAPPAGSGTPGQGYPGGIGSPLNYGGVPGTGEGGGGGGAGEAGHWKSGDPVSPLTTTTQAGGNGLSIPWAPPAYGTSGPAPGRWFAGGGGGGGFPGGSAYILGGGAGGGGAGGFYPPGYPTSAFNSGAVIASQDSGANATINTGGGGGGVGHAGASTGYGRSGSGGSGIVLIRYPYVPPPTISNVLTTASSFNVGSNIIFTVNAQNANLLTLYYSTDGNVTSANFIDGNTGSFVANASGGIVTLQANTNIPLNESRTFRLQIRQDSTTGFITGSSSANINIENPSSLGVTSTAGNIITETNYVTHVFTSSGTFAVTKAPSNIANATMEILVVGGGGAAVNQPGSPSGSAGAGAGGYIARSNVATTDTTYVVIVGAGASAPTGLASNSSFIGGSGSANINYIAVRGGTGGGQFFVHRRGGSGGGADEGYGGGAGAGWGFPGPDQQGYPGADTGFRNGGGGAGAAGARDVGGAGLVAPMSPSLGTSYGTAGPAPGRYFAGGGGGGNGGVPGVGGGGKGTFPGAPNPLLAQAAGNVNTGGGAGAFGTTGGSGIVIIRYKK